jgi:maltooligosyltrehalose trehalohydrolase
VGLGALVEDGRVRFRVWAPRPSRIEVELVAPTARRVPMAPVGDGDFEAIVDGVGAGARYFYRLDGERRRPDPASRAQPDGVHAASEVIDPAAWTFRHAAPVRRLDELVLYELHVGTFTRAGTFDAAAAELPRLAELGITAVEIMPVGAFPGTRNWGYDGVAWFAPQASYGGPAGLARLVDAAHASGLQLILDVVHNHLGPEGNYLEEFGPYFTSRHTTPWGPALDFDAAPVRRHVLESARLLGEHYRVDGLRLDAVHALLDDSPRPIAAELAAEMRALGARLGRSLWVIAESDLGDARVIETAGWGCDAQWSDDLHHALHAQVTGERQGYYADFDSPSLLPRAITDGFAYTGQPSRYRGRPFGTPAKHLPGERFVVCAQNHDQVGNRAHGERIGQLAPGCEHAVAAAVLGAPALPLVFMGEEHADPAPFLYFTDHQDAALARAVSDGRRREHGGAPDPQSPETFARSRIDLSLGERGRHAGVRRWYRTLLALRRARPSLRALDKTRTDAWLDGRALGVRRWSDSDETLLVCNLSARAARLVAPAPRAGEWRVLADAGEADYGGPAPARLEPLERALAIALAPWGAVICGAG